MKNFIAKWLCNTIEEATAEVEACKAFVAECQNNIPVDRKQVSMAKAALRAAERELRDWQKGIVPPFDVEPAMVMSAVAGA